MVEIIRGTTPTLVITVHGDLDFSMITEVWIYISQQRKPKIDKTFTDATFDPINKTISVVLSQEDTLNTRAGEAMFQMRLLLSDGTALATKAQKVQIVQIHKGGKITSG